MGVFDFLFGKKEASEESELAASGEDAPTGAGAPGPVSWQDRLGQITRADDWDWDWDNPRARQLVNEFLGECAPHFGNAKVKEMPDDGNIELRGTFEGAPIRFSIWMSFGSFWAIEMRSSENLAELYVERDHEKIPKHKDEDDPWDEDEERRVFVAKGIYFEGGDEEIAHKLAGWAKVPDALQDRILADMERLDCNIVRAYGNEIGVHQRPGLPDLEDPIAYMEDCARLMTEIRTAAPRAADASAAAVEHAGHGPVNQITCAFCSTTFLQTPARTNCPNCGAPPKG
jgi:hypothetical protein